MKNKSKIIAMYLPQYHATPENSKFWGDGYTDWMAVKNSKPLFDNHNQPRVPKDDYYYDLSDADSLRWQAKLAKEYGIDGFGIYHYWFDSEKHYLKTPAELLLANTDIDIDFFFAWDNCSWKRSWCNVEIANDWAPLYDDGAKRGPEILAELVYGREAEWEKHFMYLLNYFKDSRYMKVDNKPVFTILNQENDTDTLVAMCNFWDELAKKNGFDGMYIIGRKKNNNIAFAEHQYVYEPEWSGWTWKTFSQRVELAIDKRLQKRKVRVFDYDHVWRRIIKDARRDKSSDVFFGAFVDFDDTPRRGIRGKCFKGATPEKFKEYLNRLYEISCEKEKEFIFLVAWNEWGEGAYLEPDVKNGYAYLEAVRDVVKK